MAAGPSLAQITAGMRRGLQSLARKLAEKGIYSRYRAGTRTTYPQLLLDNANVTVAGYRLLRASNGEAALYPRVHLKTDAAIPTSDPLSGNLGPKTLDDGSVIYEGWDAFDKIVKEN